uniref:Uncharacterized protein n=1 Tax=viral metagenome TaxID=1070528 RepID=A0A6C0I4L9_9ZZZZ
MYYDWQDAMLNNANDSIDMNSNPVQQPNIKSFNSSHKFFKSAIPVVIVHNFIKKISHKMPNSEYHLIDLNAYKKAIYCSDSQTISLLEQFCNDLLPYYCKEKQVFLTRKMSYNNLNTILRQVCRHCAIECKSERKYDKSKTQIVYHISLEAQVI